MGGKRGLCIPNPLALFFYINVKNENHVDQRSPTLLAVSDFNRKMGSMLMLGLWLLLFSSLPLAFSERCHPHDKKALLQLKKDLNNPYFLASWDPNEDCCEWYCVKCDEKTHRIYDLFLVSSIPDTNLSGQIPPSLSGPIPAGLSNLDLERIDLSRNKLEGDSSMLFGSTKRMQVLDLSRNVFVFDLSRLKFPKKSLIWLDLNHNNIYGSILVALTKVENLQQFDVSYNHWLNGQILQNEELQRFDKYLYFHTKLCGSPLPPCTNK
ncbi:Polygalacturonase inhibitor [Spatholobus suberectus]|nr:Polygalacturonase inhibitor [Spatholobus suberectus]